MTTEREATTTVTVAAIPVGVKREVQPVQLQQNQHQHQHQHQHHQHHHQHQHHHHHQQLLRYPLAGGCGGDGCVARNPLLFHNVRHRGVFCRLCTSCVLRYHPGSFCPDCFHHFDGTGGGSQPPPPVVHCASCPSVSHTACLADPEGASDYVCPNCANPKGFSYFLVDNIVVDGDNSPSKKARVSAESEGNKQPQAQVQLDGQQRRMVDQKSSKVLLLAAQLASASMSRAAGAARIEAERKVKEAAVAKKRAKEMLERALSTAKREREKKTGSMVGVGVVAEQKRKETPKPGSAVAAAVAAQKRIQNREREKWMKFHDPIPLAQKPPVHAIVETDRFKGSFVGSPVNQTPSANPGHPNHAKQEERDKNRISLASQSGLIVENERGTPKVLPELVTGARVPPPNQDAQVGKTIPKAIFTGSPNTMGLHS